MIKRIKTNDGSHFGFGNINDLSYILHGRFGDVSILALCKEQKRHDCRTFSFRGIFGKNLFNFLRMGLFEAHRSISPRTISMEARMATRSATRWPFTITGKTARLSKDGVRM